KPRARIVSRQEDAERKQPDGNGVANERAHRVSYVDGPRPSASVRLSGLSRGPKRDISRKRCAVARPGGTAHEPSPDRSPPPAWKGMTMTMVAETQATADARSPPAMKANCLTWQAQGYAFREAFVRLPNGMLLEDLIDVPTVWRLVQSAPQQRLQRFDRVTAVAFD